MTRAVCLLRPPPHYGGGACRQGLKTAGVHLVKDDHRPEPMDLLVIWNRYAQYDTTAKRWEAAGAAVIVMENGYLGHHENEYTKPYTVAGDQLYALALSHHNGAGQWAVGALGRWREQGIEVRPWRTDGNHILVLPQRGIGPAGVAMPREWSQETVRALQRRTKREVRLRPHPGNYPAKKPLAADLEGCWAVITWGSGAALKAMCAGIPVYSAFPRWIGREAASSVDADLEHPMMDDGLRERMLDRLAWAQWTVPEIASGEPFKRLLALYERWVPGGRMVA